MLLPAAAWLDWLPIDVAEAFGFATGAICVWLVTQRSIWSWPVGLANNVFFAVLFWRTRLYADFGLQWVYFGLGVYGWWKWLRGGTGGTALPVSRANGRDWLLAAASIPLGTLALREGLIAVNGSAPLLDALTTVLSLVAQYLLCHKKLENWFFWIAADLIYVPLFASRGLPLIAVLYAGFLVLCLVGLNRWRKECAA